jgi:hypothetical protein
MNNIMLVDFRTYFKEKKEFVGTSKQHYILETAVSGNTRRILSFNIIII